MKFLFVTIVAMVLLLGVFAEKEPKCKTDINCNFDYNRFCGELNGVEKWFRNECLMQLENACKPIQLQFVPCKSNGTPPSATEDIMYPDVLDIIPVESKIPEIVAPAIDEEVPPDYQEKLELPEE